ncbi:MAG: hypothetical protein AB1782_06495 [Cyanobacteriota bacterium]
MESQGSLQPERKYKRCPFCSEDIYEDAILCKHCKSDLSSVKTNDYGELVKVCRCCYSENSLKAIRCETCSESLVIITDQPDLKKEPEEITQEKPQEDSYKQQENKEEKNDNTLAIILMNFFIPGLGNTVFEKKISKILIVYLVWILVALLLSIFTMGCFLIIWLLLEIIVRVVLVFFMFELIG